MRRTSHFNIAVTPIVKEQLLRWSQQYEEVLWLDSNGHSDQYGSYEAILATDALTALKTDYHSAFDDLTEYYNSSNDWIFGYLTYDLKNDLEHLESNNHDGLEFPDLYFFRPKKLIFVYKDKLVFSYLPAAEEAPEDDFNDITAVDSKNESPHTIDLKIKLRTTKDTYFKDFERIQMHIHRGDIFETNYCQEFYAFSKDYDPVTAYEHLNSISKPPFATFGKWGANFLASASPERYLARKGDKIYSQPIKGTAKRGATPKEDLQIKSALEADQKERSENIMITDLVRNDLSKVAIKGSVAVSELCQVYSFEQVHQLITTVTAQIPQEINPIAIIKATFPMGSMTGAPKVSAMKIAEDVEDFKRGLYSGTVGYIAPNGDFDFNVIIRSILYNANNHYVSFAVGGAITAAANALGEYEECLLKAKAMREVLEGNS
ncbi:MAG: anthranilate synthase component I family protein [Gilvibacter sp.]